jgi:hypothetical protein
MMLKYQYTLENSVMAEEPGRNHDALHKSQIRPAQEHMSCKGSIASLQNAWGLSPSFFTLPQRATYQQMEDRIF